MKSKDTKPEMKVKNFLINNNIIFESHLRNFPGRPDFVIREKKMIINVNGCFWHQHGCANSNTPKYGSSLWTQLNNTKTKDAINRIFHESRGWSVLDLWECSIMDDQVFHKISNLINNSLQLDYEVRS